MVLLYRVLPNGSTGERLKDCPRLDQYLAQQGDNGVPVPVESHASQKRGRADDEVPEERSKKRAAMVEKTAGPSRIRQVSAKSSRSTSRNSEIGSRTRPSPVTLRQASTSARGKLTLQSFPLSPPTTHINVHQAPVLLNLFLLANAHILGPADERAFPGSFYATDIFAILERIAGLQKQRFPRVIREDAYHSVTGINYFVLGTYKMVLAVYKHNQWLVPKFERLGHTSSSTWKKFYHEARQIGATTRGDAPIYDVDADSEDELPSQTRASSVISIADDSDDDDMPGAAADHLGTLIEGAKTFDSMGWGDSESESDADYNVQVPDWAQCCPYCDELLPLESSEDLKAMRENLDAKSILDVEDHDASFNPCHRYIRPFTDTGAYCKHHRFESHFASVLHKATWATALPVHFDSLESRVVSLLHVLGGVIDFPWQNEYYVDLQKSICENGEHATFSSKGQYISFSKISVG